MHKSIEALMGLERTWTGDRFVLLIPLRRVVRSRYAPKILCCPNPATQLAFGPYEVDVWLS